LQDTRGSSQAVEETRFPAERIMDWIDQALLQMHLASSQKIKNYQTIHIRTASDLMDNYESARLPETPTPSDANQLIVPGLVA
jgi:hypothetical protein